MFRSLHETAEPFATDFRLFAMIDDYKTLLTAKGAALPDGYDAKSIEVDAAERSSRPIRWRSCQHCDPLCENFLDTGERMFVIDFEYSGNNDPMWDLGDLSVEAGFSPEQDTALLSLLRRRRTGGAGRADGRPQSTVRSPLDLVGCAPARQRQPGGGLLGLCGRPLRAVPGN